MRRRSHPSAPPIRVDAAVGPAEEEEPEHPLDLPELVPVDDQDPSAPPRRRRGHVAEAGTQATDEWDQPDWNRFDLPVGSTHGRNTIIL